MVQFPDMLGYVTGGARQQSGVVQYAVAVRPFAVRTGQPFDVVVLLQNMADTTVDAQVSITLPKVDKKDQPDRFITKKTDIAVELKPAEFGMVVLPVACMPDAAVGSDYGIEVQLITRGKSRAANLRGDAGGAAFDARWVSEERLAELDALKQLRYTTELRRGLRQRALVAHFNVMPSAGISRLNMEALHPRWESLWAISSIDQPAVLIEMHNDTLYKKLMPKLNREVMFKPLALETKKRFAAAGFPLEERAELAVITKLLTLVLEYAEAAEHGHPPTNAGHYDVSGFLGAEEIHGDVDIPHWFMGMLKLVNQDVRAAGVPEQAIPSMLYEALLRDAAELAFTRVNEVTGEKLGSPAEQMAYIDAMLAAFEPESDPLHFGQVYMPLLLGGIAVYNEVMLPNERGDAVLVHLVHVTQARRKRFETSRNPLIFELLTPLLDRSLARYGGGRRG